METYSSINAYGYHSPSQYDPHSLHWCFHCPSTTKWVSTIPLPPHPFQQPFSSTPPPPPNPTFAPLAQIEMISNSINKIQDILTKMKERNSRMDSSFSQIRSLLHELQLESMALEDAKVEEATVEDAADNIVVCIDESALDLIDGNARAVDNSELETEHAETYSRNNVCKVFAEISNRKIAMEVGDSAKDDSGETVTQVFDKMFQSLSTPKYGLEVRAHKTPEYTHHTTLLGSPSKLFEIEFHVSIIDFPFDPGSFMLTTSSHNYFHVASSMNLRMQSSVKLFEMQSLQLSFHTKSPLFSHCSVICVVQHPAAKFYKPFATLPGIHALLISSRELWVPDSARLLATQFTRQVFHAILARERTGIMTTIGFVSPPRDTFSTHVNSATLGIFQFLWALNKTLADYVVTCSVARGSKNCVINHHFFCPVKIESSQKLSSDFLVHLTGILGNCQSSSINISALFPGLSPLLVSSMRQFQRLFMDTNIGDQLVHPKGFHAASHGFSLTSYFVDHKELGVLSVPATLDMLLLWHVCSEVARAQYLTSNDIQYSITSMVLGVGSINYNFKHGCDPVLTLFMEYIDSDASVLSLELAEQVLPINRHESYCYGLMKSYPLELGPYVDKQGATTQGFTFNSEVAWTQLGLCNIFRYDCPFRVAVQFVEKCSRTWSPLSSHLYTHSWQPITLYNLDETLMKLSFLFTNAFRWFSCTVAEQMAAPWVDIWAAMSRSLFAHLNSNLIRSDEQTLTAIARLSSPLRNSCSSPLFARNKFICGAFGFLAVNNNRVCAEGSYDATSRKCYIIHLMSLSLHTGMSPTIFYLHIEVLINIQCTLLNAQVGSGVSDKKYNWAQSLLKTKLPKCNLNEILGSMLTADEDNFLLWLQACSTRYTELTKDTFEHILFALVEVAADKSQKLTKKEELSSAIMTDFGLENTQHIEQAFSSFVCCSLNKLLVDVLAIINNETHIFYFIKMSKRVHFMLCGRKLFQQRVETEGGGQVLTVISYESLLPGKETKLRFILEMQGQLLKEGNYGCNSGVMFFRFLFGLYFSFVALFAQLGGEIVLKAADVEIDLVGTVEAGIADDDSHSPFLDLNLEDKVLIEGGSIVVNGPIYMYNGLEKVFGLGAEMKRSQQIIWDPGGENITNGPKGI